MIPSILRPHFQIRVLTLVAGLCLSACDNENGNAAGSVRPASTNSGALPKLGQVPAFTFSNQEGRPFGSKQLHGSPYLAAFMFTRCPTICPELTARMKAVHAAVTAGHGKLQILSISVDPENDTAAVLKKYAKAHGADHPDWNFLTGEYKAIATTAESGFKVGLSGKADESKPHLGITHGSHLILVDAKGQIRAYIRSSDEDVVAQVQQALKRL